MEDTIAAESLITCRTTAGVELRASPIRLSRHLVVFEIYSPGLQLQTSEVLEDLRLAVNDQICYSGRGVIRGLANAGVMTICEVGLEEGWVDIDFFQTGTDPIRLREELRRFIGRWQSWYQLEPDYKMVIADMESFLIGLRSWLDQVELGVRASPEADRAKLDDQILAEIAEPVLPAIDALFQRLEASAKLLRPDQVAAHQHYLRRQLHPLLLCSPFAYRTFAKPLGYAGDYEMVNMMLREPGEGASLFAKLVNMWFLRQPPAVAHRNRIKLLQERLLEELARIRGRNGTARFRILNVGCGPVVELQEFIQKQPASDALEATCLDFNQETLEHASAQIQRVKQKEGRRATVHFLRKPIQQLLKTSGRTSEGSSGSAFDMVYCAGLFDYLPDTVCQRFLQVFYQKLAPGGLLLVTNVDPANPLRYGMEHVLDWYLIYRDARQCAQLRPPQVDPDQFLVRADITGLNHVIEMRRSSDD